MRGLHQGLSRLADQIAKTATEASGQVGMIAQNVETLANKVAQVRDEANLCSQVMDGRLRRIVRTRAHAGGPPGLRPASGEVERVGEMVKSLERTVDGIADRLAAAEMLAIKFARVETKIETVESASRGHGQQLAGIERSIAAIGNRIEDSEKKREEATAAMGSAVETLGVRIDSGEMRGQRSVRRTALALAPASRAGTRRATTR